MAKAVQRRLGHAKMGARDVMGLHYGVVEHGCRGQIGRKQDARGGGDAVHRRKPAHVELIVLDLAVGALGRELQKGNVKGEDIGVAVAAEDLGDLVIPHLEGEDHARRHQEAFARAGAPVIDCPDLGAHLEAVHEGVVDAVGSGQMRELILFEAGLVSLFGGWAACGDGLAIHKRPAGAHDL